MSVDPDKRFWEKVDIPVDRTECWTWKGARTGYAQDGIYGSFYYGAKTRAGSAHRYAYLATHGQIPTGLVIDHRCKNTLCVNPHHMELVTNAENSRRARKHNRGITACKRGHPFTEQNTRVSKDGFRSCRICSIDRRRRYRAEARSAA